MRSVLLLWCSRLAIWSHLMSPKMPVSEFRYIFHYQWISIFSRLVSIGICSSNNIIMVTSVLSLGIFPFRVRSKGKEVLFLFVWCSKQFFLSLLSDPFVKVSLTYMNKRMKKKKDNNQAKHTESFVEWSSRLQHGQRDVKTFHNRMCSL